MTRRLYRSVTDRRLGGVAAGTADYLDVDPTMARVIWVLLTILTGFLPLGLLYLIMWWIVPEAPPQAEGDAAAAEGDAAAPARRGPSGSVVAGLVLIAVGGWFLVREFLPAFDLDWLWPVALVLVGVVLIAGATRRGRSV